MLSTARAHPRWAALVLIIACVVIAIPTLAIVAFARIQGDRR
jgi:hypothetical protein